MKLWVGARAVQILSHTGEYNDSYESLQILTESSKFSRPLKLSGGAFA